MNFYTNVLLCWVNECRYLLYWQITDYSSFLFHPWSIPNSFYWTKILGTNRSWKRNSRREKYHNCTERSGMLRRHWKLQITSLKKAKVSDSQSRNQIISAMLPGTSLQCRNDRLPGRSRKNRKLIFVWWI